MIVDISIQEFGRRISNLADDARWECGLLRDGNDGTFHCAECSWKSYKDETLLHACFSHYAHDPECELAEGLHECYLDHRKNGGIKKLIDSTFTDQWPRKIPSSKSLSDSGFYYTGIGDCVTCIICGIELLDWEDDDDVFREHIKASSGCDLVLLKMLLGLY